MSKIAKENAKLDKRKYFFLLYEQLIREIFCLMIFLDVKIVICLLKKLRNIDFTEFLKECEVI